MATKRKNHQPPRAAILTVRAALMLTLACLTGIGIGILTYLQTRQVAQAAIAGVMTTGASIALFDRVIGEH